MTSEDPTFGYLGYSTVTKDILDNINLSPELTISFDESVEEKYGRGVTYRDYDYWLQVQSINSEEAIEALEKHDIDVLLVMGWPELLDEEVLNVPELGCVGRHLSMLPKRRGRAPVAWALIHGLKSTGVSFFWLDEGVDSGPVIEQREVDILPDDHAQDLHDRCTQASISVLNDKVLPSFRDGSVSPDPQNHDAATYTHPRRPDMGLIDWTDSAWNVHNFVRGQSRPYPGAFTYHEMEKITVWRSRIVDETVTKEAPGTVTELDDDRRQLCIQCGEGIVDVTVEYVGGDAMLSVGDRLGAVPYT